MDQQPGDGDDGNILDIVETHEQTLNRQKKRKSVSKTIADSPEVTKMTIGKDSATNSVRGAYPTNMQSPDLI